MNPYFINEPAVFSFSGGRSSAFMLWKTLEAHGGELPEDLIVTFCNTGKEMPESLDFVRDCGERWGVDITWLELASMELMPINSRKQKNRNEYSKTYKVVTYETASRNGEPFDILLNTVPAIPNGRDPICTAYLKTRLMRMYAYDRGLEQGCLTIVGMRADEMSRVVNLHNKKVEGFEGYCPMYVDSITKEDVSSFWDQNNFDLQLHNNNGVTDFGNCDLCFKKATNKRISIIRERPDLVDWWINVEAKKQQKFKPNLPGYQTMKMIATDQGNLFDFPNDESVPCICGD